MRTTHIFKRGLAVILTFCIVSGWIPCFPEAVTEVQAATKEPSIATFATKAQLMSEFTLQYSDSSKNTIGYINYGKDYNGNTMKWHIVGEDKDTRHSGDNVVLFAARTLTEGVNFQNQYVEEILKSGELEYTYEKTITSVAANNYGYSSIRALLSDIVKEGNTTYFSENEKDYINTTELIHLDKKNNTTYTTEDKLYLGEGYDYASDTEKMYFGSNISESWLTVAPKALNQESGFFWLRTPDTTNTYGYVGDENFVVSTTDVRRGNLEVRPAFSLELNYVDFASAAKPASIYKTESFGRISAENGMNLKLKSGYSDKEMRGATVIFNKDTARYSGSKGMSVVIQGNDGTGDWYYSKYLTTDTASGKISALDVRQKVGLSTTPDFEQCKIWIETTSSTTTDWFYGFTFAKMGVNEAAVDTLDITLSTPSGGSLLDTSAQCGQDVIQDSTVTWLDESGNKVSETRAEHNKKYIAVMNFKPKDVNAFSSSMKVTIKSFPADSAKTISASNITLNEDRSLTVRYEYDSTGAGKIELGTQNGYSGVYDGRAHTIELEVKSPEGTTISYSTDKKNYSATRPEFTEAGEYKVYYKVEKAGYKTEEGMQIVVINPKPVHIKPNDQNILKGEKIDQTKYSITAGGLLWNHKISGITLVPSTEEVTTSGTITARDVKIADDSGVDKTKNYQINTAEGKLTIVENTTIIPKELKVTKKKLVYVLGEMLNTDDIVVEVTFTDGHSEKVKDFTTNAAEIDMKTGGEKKLVVEYTKNNGTVRKEIDLVVNMPLKIISQPEPVEVQAEEKATFKVSVQGLEPITYQWMINKGGKGWTVVSGATKSEYTTSTLNVSDSGAIYKCLIANAAESVETEEASLTVAPLPVDIELNEDVTFESGSAIDVSELFLIDENAGEATYTLVTGEEGGTGVGTLSGTTLKITKSGSFVIRVTTAPQGNYDAGEAEITIRLSEDNQVFFYKTSGYNGVYDGEPHAIGIEVPNIDEVNITYSTDEDDDGEYSDEVPEFTEVGEYTVYYMIESPGIQTITGEEIIVIDPREITITPSEQTLTWNGAFDVTEFDAEAYDITYGELVEGHSVTEVTLTPTMNLDGSVIIANDVVIVDDESGEEVTDNYEITYAEGSLIVEMVEPEIPDDYYEDTTEEVVNPVEEYWEEEYYEEEDDWDEWNNLEVYNGDAKYKVKVTASGNVKVTYLEPKRESVTSVVIPATVTLSDGTKAKVTAIAPRAFRHCNKLASVVIGKNVVSIGKKAFDGCKSLKKITIKTKKLNKKKVGGKAFSRIQSSAEVKVPKAKAKAYKAILKAKGLPKTAKVK